jgi:hypothetical protein
MKLDTERGIDIGLFTGGVSSVLLGQYVLHSPEAVTVGGIAMVGFVFYAIYLREEIESNEKKASYEKGYEKGLSDGNLIVLEKQNQ